jgi:ectoine hydroxylase-related dioxygenase (phytanoyl-CoA dioxygenase family)
LSIDTQALHKLHNIIPKKYLPRDMVTVENDQDQEIYKLLYKIDRGYDLKASKPNDSFLLLFDKFVKMLSEEVFRERLVYQAKPTLRVMFPNNRAVGGWHRDRDYNHPIEEINIWVPITSALETNTIWIETEFDLEDYKPINVSYGELIIFDSNLKHGNKINQENKTRLSFDFRIIPERVLRESTKESFNQKIKFSVGDYYNITD